MNTYDVTIYAIVPVRVRDVEAASPLHAIKKASKQIDFAELFPPVDAGDDVVLDGHDGEYNGFSVAEAENPEKFWMFDASDREVKPNTVTFSVPGPVDWELLRRQKDYLLTLVARMDNAGGSEDKLIIDGLIELLDAIQDAAVDNDGVPEKTVFGEIPYD